MNLLFPRFRQFIAQNRADALSIFALALLPFLFHWQEALRQAVFFFGDILLFFYPTHLAYATALRAGQLPLWEPRMLTGFPLFAEGQIAAFYPTHPLLYGLLPIDLATNYDILTSLAWVSVGMYLFLRVINLRPPSAFLGALALGLGGFFTVRMQHMSVLTTASWLPWLFWCWEKHEQEADSPRRWRWWVVLAVFAGIQMLGGHPQFAFMSIVLLGLYATVNWQRASVPQLALPMPFNRWLGPVTGFFQPQRAIPLVVAIVLGAAIAAVQLMPTFELSMYSNRAAGLLPKFFNAFSLRAVHYLMLFHPFILGNPYPRVSVEVIGYIGFLSVTFALAAPFVERNRRVIFFLAMALVALFLGLGDQNAFYRGLRYLPLFNYFRVPSRFLFWYSFAAAVLAAITFDYLLARAKTTPRFMRGQIIAIALFAILIPTISGLVPTFPLDTWLSIWVWLPIVLACLTAWIVLCARHALFTRTMLIALVIGLTLADLSLFAAVYAKTYDLSVPVDDFYKPPSSLAVIEGLKPEEGRVLTSLWIYPVMVTMRESLYPNVSLSHNIPNATGYTPLIPQRTGDYFESLTATMMNLMNVHYYIKPQMLPTDAKTEGEDVENEFTPDFVNHFIKFSPTPATRIKVVSSLAQSVSLRDGDVVAVVDVVTQDGQWLAVPLRAGYDTAEWAYERTDVRKVIQHSLPPLASTFPARSAFPTESHPGHTYLAQLDLPVKPARIAGIIVFPAIEPGLLHIEKISLVSPDGKEISIADLVGKSDQSLIYRTNEVAVFRNDDVLPRMFLVHNARVTDDATVLREIQRDDFKPLEVLYLADGQPISAGGAQLPDETVRVIDYQNQRVVLSAQVQADAYLFLGDAWYPDWVVRVDGIETPIQRADYIFRAVRLTPGMHQIEFEYRPRSLIIGAVISVATLIVLAVIWIRNRG